MNILFIAPIPPPTTGHSLACELLEHALQKNTINLIKPTFRQGVGSALRIAKVQCSMSFFEVQACGLPVLFEKNEINDMRVAGNNAFTFEPGSIDSFRAKLVWLASQPSGTFQAYSSQAREYVLRHFDFVPIARQYSAVLFEAREKWNQRRIGTTHNPRTLLAAWRFQP